MGTRSSSNLQKSEAAFSESALPDRDISDRGFSDGGFAEVALDATAASFKETLTNYIHISRPDHWFKNIFVLPGVLLACYFFPLSLDLVLLGNLALALLAVCLVASSNYVVNEVLDAERDKHHPVKKTRPLAAGKISVPVAYAQWILLGVIGISLGYLTNSFVGGSCAFLWIMGTIYNVPPVRTKELPFLDVLSESINNPIRLAVGWYCTGVEVMPPISALFAYWMFGAFLMATKRLAEYRRIGDPQRAAEYRKSFSYYDEERLVVGTVFYVALFMTGAVVFTMLYRLELILAMPLVAYLLAYYLYLGFAEDSPVQYPEKLYREQTLRLAVGLCTLLCLVLFVWDIPQFRELFVLLSPAN